jgi:hypothetical protein
MRVYRVEDENGCGPWRAVGDHRINDGASSYDENARRHSCGEGPAPYSDGIMIRDEQVCGTRTLKQFRMWFRCARGRAAMARNAGLRLCVYDVPREHVQVGGYQVMFTKDRATLVGMRDLRTLRPVPMD